MTGKELVIPTPDGTMDGYAAYPDGGGPFPLVVMFMDVWGLREELFAIARRIASHGYYCIVPNLFYRAGKIRFERRNADGKMVSFDTLPAALQDEMRGYSSKVDRPRARVDIAAMLDFCRGEPVAPGPAGSVGFCLGGRAAFYAGQEFPARFLANASLHGTHLATEGEDSPHRFVDRMRAKFIAATARSTAWRRRTSSRPSIAPSPPTPMLSIAAICMPAPITAMRCRTATFTPPPPPRPTGARFLRCSAASSAHDTEK